MAYHSSSTQVNFKINLSNNNNNNFNKTILNKDKMQIINLNLITFLIRQFKGKK